jgi:hypothetical protein
MAAVKYLTDPLLLFIFFFFSPLNNFSVVHTLYKRGNKALEQQFWDAQAFTRKIQLIPDALTGEFKKKKKNETNNV